MQATGCLTDNPFGSRIGYSASRSRSLLSCSRPNYEQWSNRFGRLMASKFTA